MDTDLDQLMTGSHYKFSATKIDALGASEYTLAHLVVDESGSVSNFKAELEKAMLATKQACEKSPRAENLLLRATAFAGPVRELHGFKLLKTIRDDDYIDALRLGGSTALHRATHEALEATLAYARTLADQEFLTNAITVIVTDGEEMVFDVTTDQIAELIRKARLSEEVLESLTVVLVGITGNQITTRKLARFPKGSRDHPVCRCRQRDAGQTCEARPIRESEHFVHVGRAGNRTGQQAYFLRVLTGKGANRGQVERPPAPHARRL
jgi:hypothetical protein